jgi:hypothetical protein
MAAGVADTVWTINDLVGLLEAAENAMPTKRGSYGKSRERKAAADSK